MKHFEPPVAAAALARWDGDPATLLHVATSGNAVYQFLERGTPRILRLTDIAYRSPEHQQAEMSFLHHLEACGVRVAAPVRSRNENLVERFGDHTACVLAWAPGERVAPGSHHWNDAFVRAWGRSLGAIHAAARSYDGPPRWHWRDEVLLADAGELLPRDDAAVRAEFATVAARLDALTHSSASYGMNHADYGPQNFHWDPALGITSFDFGNCCSHAFVHDLVIATSLLWRLPDRDRWGDALMDGYRERMELDAALWEERHTFLRMRQLYVYLSRLRKFGPDPDPDQREVLRTLRAMIRSNPDWP